MYGEAAYSTNHTHFVVDQRETAVGGKGERTFATGSCFGLIRERLGDSVPEPLGFFALSSIPQEAGLGDLRRPSLRYSSPPRRSGCFPAEPYPPSGRTEFQRTFRAWQENDVHRRISRLARRWRRRSRAASSFRSLAA